MVMPEKIMPEKTVREPENLPAVSMPAEISLPAKAPVTLSDGLISDWINYIDCSAKTAQTYTGNVKQFLRFLASKGIQNVSEISREVVIDFRESLQSKKVSTQQAYMTAARLFLQWMVDSHVLQNNPAAHVKAPKTDKGFKHDALSAGQCRDLISAADTSTLQGLRDRAMIATMLTTGLRTVSIANADTEDLRIRRNWTTEQDELVLYYQGKRKNEKSEFVKISAPVAQMISEYLDARNTGRSSAERNSGPLFQSCAHRNPGQRMTTNSISRICKTRLRETGIDSDRITAHSLRHSTAIQALLNGASLEQVQDLLGHSSIDTTRIYSHALERNNNNAEYQISAVIFGNI